VVVGKIESAWNRGKYRPKDSAGELKALVAFSQFEASQVTHEVVVPERTPILTVGDCFESSRLLHDNGLPNGIVFNL
jgi:hypothetical protein